MSDIYNCHCCKQSKCECASTNDNGLYDFNPCNINNHGNYTCNKKKICMCENPPPYLWKIINESSASQNLHENSKK